MTALQSKYSGWLIHLTAWAVIFGMPLFVTSPDRPLMTGSEYLRFLLVPLSFMVVFYTNYFLLIERYLFTRQTGRFLGGNALLIAAVIVGLHLLFRYVLPPDAQHPPLPRPWQDSVRFFAGNAALYLLVVGAGVAIRMTGGWYKAEAARQELEHSRTQAELQNLKSQLNPHFLFNTLNNIYSLIQIDADRAQQAVHDLSRMLRYVLYESSCPTVPLAAEVEFLRDYIELMRIRLPRHVEVGVSLDRTTARARGPAAVHLADRECLQTRYEQRQTVVHPDRHPRAGRRTGLLHPQQLFPQDGFGSERFGHRAEKPLETAGDDLSATPHLRIRRAGRHLHGVAAHQIARTMKLNCAIIDDEPLAVELMAGYVRKTPFLTLCGSFGSGSAAFDMLRDRPVDLLFCDIQMPGLSGMELSRMLPADTRVIFTTAFSRYAVEGFRVNAVDYLLKPISYADFLAAANKALAWFELKNRAETPPPAAAPQSLFVKTEYRLRQIGFDSILYIEGLKDYVKIHVEEETHPVLTLTSLKSLEEQLPADRFVRVHRSFIVQPSKIRSIERNRIVFGKEYIPVSENYRQAFFDFLAEHSLLF